MKLNIANPLTGAQAMVEIEDDRKLAVLWDRRIAQEVPGDELGDEFKGYVFKITGGCDKQGFPMKQGVLVPHRVRLLLGKQPGFWRPNRDGAHRRRSVRGCIVAQDIASLNLVLVKQGETPLPALERVLPRRLGPKRASKIRKLFNLSKEDDVRKYVIRREIPLSEKDKEKGKRKQPRTKAPRIQRLVTARTLQHKRHILALKKRWSAKSKADAAEYAALLAARKAEKAKKSQKVSERKSEKKTTAAAAPAKATKAAAKPAAKPAAKAAPVATPAAATTTTSKATAGKKKASGKK